MPLFAAHSGSFPGSRRRAPAFAVLAMLGAFFGVARAQTGVGALPDELKHIEKFAGDEMALVERARRYDRMQTALAAWDRRLAEEYERGGDPKLAETQRKQANHRIELVRQTYEWILAGHANNARVQTYYGELLYDYYGEIPGALRAWQMACSLDPNLSAPLNDLGIHYCHSGDYEMGLRNYERALKLEPRNPDYLYNIAQTYLINPKEVARFKKWDDRTKVYREAMRMSRKSAECAPGSFELVQDYAVNFFAAGNFGVEADWEEAAKAWQAARALARTPEEVFYAWLNEARVWKTDGNKKKAAQCLDEALKIRPDSETARKILDGLNTGQDTKP